MASAKASLASPFKIHNDGNGSGFGARYALATRDLSPGMLVFSEQPLVWNTSKYSFVCTVPVSMLLHSTLAITYVLDDGYYIYEPLAHQCVNATKHTQYSLLLALKLVAVHPVDDFVFLAIHDRLSWQPVKWTTLFLDIWSGNL